MSNLTHIPAPMHEGNYEANRDARRYACEAEAEAWSERQFNRLDRRLMRGEIGQPEYKAEAMRIAEATDDRYHANLDAAGF